MIKRIWKLVKWGFMASLITLVIVLISNFWIVNTANEKLYTSTSEIPKNDVGLVLGASMKTPRGTTNLYFKYRMEAAARLYKAGKIKHILVSGDNHSKSYDEATDMKNYLVRLGVPASRITLDYAGFRTLDSVVRCKKVFGQSNITIISQEFHNQRAVFLAQKKGLNAVGYNAKEVPKKYSKFNFIREYLAKFKAVLDIYILRKQPKFLGDPVAINV